MDTNNKNKQSNPTFTGLKKQLERKIYPDYDTLQALYNANSNGRTVAGKPPREITEAIKADSVSSADTAEKINKFINAFSLASKEMSNAEAKSVEYIQDFNSDKYISKFISKNEDFDIIDIISGFSSYYGVNHMPESERQKYEEKAAKHIEQAAKDIGIMPKNGTVKLEYIGIGAFGAAYNISFTDENNKKIFHDKVLKVYRNKDNEVAAVKVCLEKLKAVCDNSTYDEFYKKYSKVIKNPSSPSVSEDDTLVQKCPQTREISNSDKILRSFFDAVKSADIDNCEEYFNEAHYPCMSFHGCLAEANRAMFLNKSVQHIETSNFIEPYFFDIDNGFGLFEKADDTLPEIKTVIDLSEFDLEHGDANKDRNSICGRVIDYGGIREKDYFGRIICKFLDGMTGGFTKKENPMTTSFDFLSDK